MVVNTKRRSLPFINPLSLIENIFSLFPRRMMFVLNHLVSSPVATISPVWFPRLKAADSPFAPWRRRPPMILFFWSLMSFLPFFLYCGVSPGNLRTNQPLAASPSSSTPMRYPPCFFPTLNDCVSPGTESSFSQSS